MFVSLPKPAFPFDSLYLAGIFNEGDNMSRVVVVVGGGVINQVLVDNPDTKVLVVDRDSGVSREHLLVDVLGAPAALDAMLQGAGSARVDEAAVDTAFCDVRECLDVPGINQQLREEALDKLVSRTQSQRPDNTERVIAFVKRELEEQQLDTLSFRAAGDAFVLADTRVREQIVAEFSRTDGQWATRVLGYNDEEDETPSEQKYLPLQATLFVAAVQALEYFDREAIGAFCLY